MKHVIISRMAFRDKNLFNKYLKISKEILIPSLNSQLNKNFEFCVLIRPEDVKFVREFLEIDFSPFYSVMEYIEYVKKNNIEIQTRHDMDDYMSEDYVKRIQEEYEENIRRWDSFLIQAQPVKLLYDTKEEVEMGLYTDKRNSMFLSLCQKKVVNHIFERKHGQMHEITPNVISLPPGYTKWVIHEDNISILRKGKQL